MIVRAATSQVAGRFDTWCGMRRAELAPAGLYNSVGRANIATTGIRIEAIPSKRVDRFALWPRISLRLPQPYSELLIARDIARRLI